MAKESKEKSNSKVLPCYCIRCGSVWSSNFYISYNSRHAGGKLPYCKQCVSDIFRSYYYKQDCDIQTALYLTCRALDIPYAENQFNNAVNQLEKEKLNNKDYDDTQVIKYYISYLNNMLRYVPDNKTDFNFDDSDVSFDIIKKITSIDDIQDKIDYWKKSDEYSKEEELRNLRKRFGDNFKDEELIWLRDEYENYASSYKIQGKMMVDIIEEMCKVRLRLRNTTDIKEIDSLQKTLKSLTEQSGLNKTKVEDGKDVIGMVIKDIEETRPAEDENLKKKYKDIDGYEKMFKVFFVAPIKRSIGIGSEDPDVCQMEKEIEQYKISEDDILNFYNDEQ